MVHTGRLKRCVKRYYYRIKNGYKLRSQKPNITGKYLLNNSCLPMP